MLILVSDEEVDAGVKVAVAMYLYATAHSITALEMAGHDPAISRTTPYSLPEDESIGMAAEE